ncbi:unnamed protein product [Boreogadus saida]
MGFVQRAWSSGQPWGSVGTLLGWTASRLQPDWAARLFHEDGETRVLTETDELSRTYCEESSCSPNSHTPASGGTRTSPAADRTAAAATAASPHRGQPSRATATEERPSPSNANRHASMKWVGPGAKQQIITTLTSTGPRTTTSTALLPPQYLRRFSDTGTHEAEEPRATADTVSCMINSPVDATHPSTADATRTSRTPGLAGGKVGRRNQGVPAPEPGAAAQRRPANVTGPQEEAQLGLWSREGDGGGVRGRGGDGEERRAEAGVVPTCPQEEGQTLGERGGDGEVRSPAAEGALGPPRPSITTWEAGWNVTNAIQGMFVLGLPYALVRSGYLGLLLLVLAAWICNHTGTILVACLYEEEHHGCSCGLAPRLVRVRHSYQDIAEACCKGLRPNWAGLAGWMVNIAQVVELLMTCTLYLVVSASLLSDSLWWTAVPRSACSLASVLLLLPCLVLTDLRPVSTLSMLCSLAHGLISLLVILYCLSASRGWSLSALSLAVEPGDFLVSVGVIIFSYTSQIFLPTLEGSMEHRGQFPAMLGHTHAAACVLKTAFSLLAVLTWGRDTSEVITDNLPANLRPFVNLGLVAKALLSYPLPFYSAAQILQTCFLRGTAASASPQARRGPPARSRLGLLVRGGLLGTSYLLALLVPRFSLLMGLTGSVTGAAMTLTLPCLFHLRLRWCRLGARERLIDGAILSLGLLCSTSGLICSLKRLVEGL